MEIKKAYIQCDWVASKASGDLYDQEISTKYHDVLKKLQALGYKNCASWSTDSKTEAYKETKDKKAWHAIRNTSEVDLADIVVSLFYRKNPPYFHWGSIAIIAYAIGKGKTCYVMAEDDCVIWKHHILYHPQIKRIYKVTDI